MKIIGKDGHVIIDVEIIEGFISDDTCSECGEKRIYYDLYDAFFCPSCNIWLEETCDDPTCDYCRKRPKKPLENK